MTTARGLSFDNRDAKVVVSKLGTRGRIQYNIHQCHATAHGVSLAAAKHFS